MREWFVFFLNHHIIPVWETGLMNTILYSSKERYAQGTLKKDTSNCLNVKGSILKKIYVSFIVYFLFCK